MTLPSDNRAILCFGEAIVDLVGLPPGTIASIRGFEPRFGGAPCNVAIGLTRLGFSAAYVGAVADDEFGRWLRARLIEEGVETRLVVPAPDAQTRLAIVTGPANARSFRFYGHPAADTLLTPEVISSEDIGRSAGVYLGALPLRDPTSAAALRHAVELATAQGIPVCFDPNPRASMWRSRDEVRAACLPILRVATVAKLSTTDLEVLGITEAELRQVVPAASVYVVTDGARGCRYWIGEHSGWQTAFEVEEVDGTGAGDAFMAALIARGVASGFDYTPEDISFAAAAGALATTRPGGADALPTGEDVLRLVSS